MRPVSKIGKLGVNAEMIAPIKNAPIPVMMICRVVNYLVSKLESGRIIPITSIYPVTIH